MSNADRTYIILGNRIEQRLEKPRVLMQHMGLFAAYTVVFGGMSIISRPMGNMDGIFYWTIFAWSVLVGMHTLYAYMRSGAWTATREQFIQEEILEYANEFELSETEMVDMHQRLSENVEARAGIFRKLARIGSGYFIVWPGSMLLLFILKLLITGPYGRPEDNAVYNGLMQLWQPLSLLGTFALSTLLIPWQRLFPPSNTQNDLLKVYQGKGKRNASDRLSTDGFDESGEIMQGYDEDSEQHIRRSGIEPSLG